MTRRVHPLVSLNPYQGSWTIKVRVTSKGSMRTYRNARGEGCIFNVELTDEDVSGIPLFNSYLVVMYLRNIFSVYGNIIFGPCMSVIVCDSDRE